MTQKQTLALQCLIEHPDWTGTKIAAYCNGTDTWLSRLKRQPEFQAALERGLHEVWKDATAGAVKTMIELSENGDREAAKYILQCNGFAPDTDINIRGNISINIDYGE